MPQLSLKPSHAPIRAYYKALEQFGKLGFDNEGDIRGTFEELLKKCCGQFHWTVVPDYQMSGKDNRRISVDACLIDEFHLPRGYWEAKDARHAVAGSSALVGSSNFTIPGLAWMIRDAAERYIKCESKQRSEGGVYERL